MATPDPWIEQFEERHRAKEDARRSFTLLGETFRVKPDVAPEVAFRFNDFVRDLQAFVVAVQEAEAAGKPVPQRLGVEDSDMLALSEATIRACLTPGSVAAWESLRNPERENPLGLWEIYGFARFTLTKATELPTAAPTGSSNGREPTTPSSAAASPSRAPRRRR